MLSTALIQNIPLCSSSFFREASPIYPLSPYKSRKMFLIFNCFQYFIFRFRNSSVPYRLQSTGQFSYVFLILLTIFIRQISKKLFHLHVSFNWKSLSAFGTNTLVLSKRNQPRFRFPFLYNRYRNRIVDNKSIFTVQCTHIRNLNRLIITMRTKVYYISCLRKRDSLLLLRSSCRFFFLYFSLFSSVFFHFIFSPYRMILFFQLFSFPIHLIIHALFLAILLTLIQNRFSTVFLLIYELSSFHDVFERYLCIFDFSFFSLPLLLFSS